MEITKISKGCAAGFTEFTNKLAVVLTEDGKKWRELTDLENQYSNYSANDVLVLNTRVIFIVGGVNQKGGFLLYSFDGGNSWKSKEFPTIIAHVAVMGPQIWLSSEQCMVYKSDSYVDQNWETFNLNEITGIPKDMNLQGIDCVKKDEVYTVGNINEQVDGVICKTTDGGKTWENLDVPKPSTGVWLNFIGVVVVSDNLVFFHGGTGLLLKWKDRRWEYLREPQKSPGHDINGLFVSNENDLWLACDWQIQRILNGETVDIPCQTGGNFMTGIYVWGNCVWASGVIGASAPTPGILTYSENLGAEGSWKIAAEKELWKVSLHAERILEEKE